MDQPRGTTQIRDAALSGGAGPTSGTIAAASASRASRAGRGGDRVQPAPTTPSSPDSDNTVVVVVVVVHLAEPPAEEEPVHVFHQHRDGVVVAPEEEGHLQAVQPPADVGDPHVGRGGSVGRAGDPRSERVPGCAHALGLHSHFIAAAAASSASSASATACNGHRPAAADTVAAGAERAAYPRLGVGAGAELADQPAATTGANTAAPVAGHRGGQRQLLLRRERWVSIQGGETRVLWLPVDGIDFFSFYFFLYMYVCKEILYRGGEKARGFSSLHGMSVFVPSLW